MPALAAARSWWTVGEPVSPHGPQGWESTGELWALNQVSIYTVQKLPNLGMVLIPQLSDPDRSSEGAAEGAQVCLLRTTVGSCERRHRSWPPGSWSLFLLPCFHLLVSGCMEYGCSAMHWISINPHTSTESLKCSALSNWNKLSGIWKLRDFCKIRCSACVLKLMIDNLII